MHIVSTKTRRFQLKGQDIHSNLYNSKNKCSAIIRRLTLITFIVFAKCPIKLFSQHKHSNQIDHNIPFFPSPSECNKLKYQLINVITWVALLENGSVDPRIHRSKGQHIQGSMDPRVDIFKGRPIQGSTDPRVERSKGRQIQWSTDPKVDIFKGRQIQGSKDPWVDGSKGR